MRDVALVAAGALAALVAVVHGSLLELRVFATTRVEPERMRRLVHAVCQMSTVDWIAIAVLLMAAPWFGSQPARHWVVAAAVVAYGVAAAGNLWALRRPHPGWMLMSAVVVLALVGR